MDLEAALGRPVGTMPEADFTRWRGYAARKGLPQRRTEFYLAQIALLIARYMGGVSEASLSDFLFDPQRDAPTADVDLDEAKSAFQFNPHKKVARDG